jgi:hypothetical protein
MNDREKTTHSVYAPLNRRQQLTDRSCHERCIDNPRTKSASPDAPAAESQDRYTKLYPHSSEEIT